MQRRPLARRWLDAGVGAAGGQGALRGRRDIAVGDLAPALETQRDGFLSGQMASGRDTGAVDGVHSGAGEDPRSFTAMLEPRQQDRERARLVRPSPVAARQPQTLADCQASRPGSAPGGCHDLKYPGPPPRTPLWPAGRDISCGPCHNRELRRARPGYFSASEGRHQRRGSFHPPPAHARGP